MIKKAAEMKAEVRSQMRGGKGDVKILHLFDEKAEMKGHTRLFARITLEPGASIGVHEHLEEEEAYYILRGRARVVDGEKIGELGPGDAILTGNGGSHAIENIGDEPLEFMAVVLTYKNL